jgi:hypothetical protein
MKLRTIAQLQEHLDSDHAWRRKELTTIVNFVRSSPEKSQAMSIRAGMLMVYAHWEGFIKYGAECYLSFVAMQGLPLSQLDYPFIALCARRKLHDFESSGKAAQRTELVRYLLGDSSGRARVPYEGIINTQSNLSSEVLREIVQTLGLEYSPYQLKEKLIDVILLKSRNEIAHGQFLRLRLDDFEELYDEVKNMMDTFHNQIENAALTTAYRRV